MDFVIINEYKCLENLLQTLEKILNMDFVHSVEPTADKIPKKPVPKRHVQVSVKQYNDLVLCQDCRAGPLNHDDEDHQQEMDENEEDEVETSEDTRRSGKFDIGMCIFKKTNLENNHIRPLKPSWTRVDLTVNRILGETINGSSDSDDTEVIHIQFDGPAEEEEDDDFQSMIDADDDRELDADQLQIESLLRASQSTVTSRYENSCFFILTYENSFLMSHFRS
jgi:hypothetical protein